MNSPADLDLSGVLATLEQRKHQLEKELRAKLLEMQSDHIGFDSNSPIDGGDAATLDDAEGVGGVDLVDVDVLPDVDETVHGRIEVIGLAAERGRVDGAS